MRIIQEYLKKIIVESLENLCLRGHHDCEKTRGEMACAISPLIFAGNSIYGPLMIWEIAYPPGFSVDPALMEEYLSVSTPKWMNLSVNSVLDQ